LTTKQKLSDVIQVNPRRQLKKGNIAPFVAMENIVPYEKQISEYTQRKISGSNSKFKNGDTLLAKITPSLENGKTVFVDFLKKNEIGHGSTEFFVLCGKENQILDQFVYYLMRTSEFREEAIRSMTGTSGRQRVQETVFDDYEIILPTISIQEKISKPLSDLDAKIQNLRNQNRILEQMAQAIFKSWFVDFDGVTEFEDSELGKIPKGWSTNILDYIANNIRNTIKSKDITSEIFYIGLEHMPRDKVGLDTWENSHDLKSNKFKFETNHILFGKLRPYFKKVGISPIDGICSTDILVLDSKETQWLEFLLFTVSSYDFIEYASQSTTGTRMPRTDWNYMKNYKIILPPETMVLKFHKIIKKSIEMMKTNIFEIKALTKTRDVLLPKLMSGEIRV